MSIPKLFSALLFMMYSYMGFSQNVGINSTGSAPAASAGLDVNFTDKGLLIPQVALVQTSSASPITSPANSLLVYNTASGNDVTPGYYYWNSTLWTRLASGGAGATSQWTTTGTDIYKNNSGKVGIGTTAPAELLDVRGNAAFGADAARPIKISTSNDANSVDIYTEADKPFRISNNGLVNGSSLQLKGSAESHLFSFEGKGGFRYYSRNTSAEKFKVNDAGDIFLTTTNVNTAVNALGSINNFYQMNIKNSSAGTAASTDVVATNNNATETYINMGINSTGNTSSGVLGGTSMAYLHCAGAAVDLSIGNSINGRYLRFFTNGGSATERMRILSSGEIGIGTTTVTSGYLLEVNGAVMSRNVVPKTDDTYDLGTASLRWDDVYATNGTIQTSDRRLKTNIADLKYGLKEVMALRPVSYNWKDKPNTNNKIGLIAQDTRKIVPEVVRGDESKENIGMNYAELIPVLINAIQEQQKQISDLKMQVETLQNKK